MAGFPIGQDDGFWAELTNDPGESQLVFASGVNIGVRHAKSVAPAHVEELRCLSRLLGANLWSASGAHLARGQVENARFVSELGHFQHRAAASEFHVVRMRGDGEKIEVQKVASWLSEGGFYTADRMAQSLGWGQQGSYETRLAGDL